MQIIRTVIWVVIVAILVAFVAMNWESAAVNLWPLGNGYLHFDWPVGVIAIVFFLLGLVPMWLLAKAGRWRMKRRLANLENAVRAQSPTPPLATSTQLAAADHSAEG